MAYPARRYLARDEGGPSDVMAPLRNHLRACLTDRDFRDALRMLEELLTANAEDALGLGRARMPPAEDGEGGGWATGPAAFSNGAHVVAEDVLAMDAAPGSASGQLAFRRALRFCEPILGQDAALRFDTAEAVMRASLRELGIREANSVHKSGLQPLLDAAMRQRGGLTANSTSTGMWSRPSPTASDDRDFRRRFPNAAAVRSLG